MPASLPPPLEEDQIRDFLGSLVHCFDLTIRQNDRRKRRRSRGDATVKEKFLLLLAIAGEDRKRRSRRRARGVVVACCGFARKSRGGFRPHADRVPSDASARLLLKQGDIVVCGGGVHFTGAWIPLCDESMKK